MGKKLIIANWKMNLGVHEGSLFVHKLDTLVGRHPSVEIVIAPSMLTLQPLHLQVQHHHFNLAAQNFYWQDSGAFTGEVSAAQLHGLIRYGLVGHSERRHIFGEHGKDIRNKVQAAYRNGFTPVLCVGETAHERSENETNDVLHDQLVGGLANITSEEADSLVVAYEPVWAIGTGSVPTSGDIESAVRAIRSQIKHLFGEQTAAQVRVLYGGSVNIDNATSILAVKGVDGLLVGGASLNVEGFAEIIKKAQGPKSVKKKVNR
ncbi:MAG: triose-phosphate isomerase [Candidatus Saccharimonas sp.]